MGDSNHIRSLLGNVSKKSSERRKSTVGPNPHPKARWWWRMIQSQNYGGAVILAFTILTCFYFYYCFTLPESPPFVIHKINGSFIVTGPGDHDKAHGEPWCSDIPKLEPFHESIKHLLKTPSFPKCENKAFPLLFSSTLNSTIVPVKSVQEFRDLSIRSCCYRVVKREYGAMDRGRPDNQAGFSKDCYPVYLSAPTFIPDTNDFLAIFCEKVKRQVRLVKKDRRIPWSSPSNWTMRNETYLTYSTELMDMIPFVHVKREGGNKKSKNGSSEDQKKLNKLSVLILGIDSMSHMNFIRTFRRSHQFLVKEMNAVEMNWYNKVEDNTYPNLIPMLTGTKAEYIDGGCANLKVFDTCPLIWKDFKKKGYVTAFAEDASDISIFNHEKRGFQNPPTDYYLRPFMKTADLRISTFKRKYTNLCLGPRLGFEVLLDYLKKFVYVMETNSKPYFHFTWATSLTHDLLNDGLWGDFALLETFKWLKGHLDELPTVFILMADHGRRFGEIRSYLQGQLEDRLPMLYFVFPKKIRENYRLAYENVLKNTNSLVTTFDLHKLLRDILDSDGNLAESEIKRRQEVMKNSTKVPEGISPFLEIPRNRTCQDAWINQNFCACNKMEAVKNTSRGVKEGAQEAVKWINNLIKANPKCMRHRLLEVKSVYRVGKEFKKWEALQIKFVTAPGKGEYEALVARETNDYFRVSGTIERTNTYGNQSSCVDGIKLKYYCYCKNVVSI